LQKRSKYTCSLVARTNRFLLWSSDFEEAGWPALKRRVSLLLVYDLIFLSSELQNTPIMHDDVRRDWRVSHKL
jgi:hypothetical protein